MSLPARSNLPQHCSGPQLSRREILRAGLFGCGAWAAGSLALPQLLAAEAGTPVSSDAALQSSATADNCIILFLNGGPSHLDMWDMKPEAPIEIRGSFSPIASSLVGVPVCELLPGLAKWMHRTTLVRSMHHSVNNAHAAAVYTALTGHDRGEIGGGAARTDHPPPGSVLARLRPPSAAALPYVALPYKTKEGAGGPLQPGFLSGFMGQNFDPFWVLSDPNSPAFDVPNMSLPRELPQARVTTRRELLEQLNIRFAAQRSGSGVTAIDRFHHQAFDLLTSNRAQEAFRLDREPDTVRESYGRNIYGQSVLLARRLIESGTRTVTISWAPDANATWDTHGGNFTKLKNELLPQFDAAAASLLADLDARGMLKRTLVAVLGDFGRTPKINTAAGRDHWNACYTIMLSGGGFKEGFVYGSSDRIGGTPASDAISPADILATMYRALGVDHRLQLRDTLDRPHELVPQGDVVDGLLA